MPLELAHMEQDLIKALWAQVDLDKDKFNKDLLYKVVKLVLQDIKLADNQLELPHLDLLDLALLLTNLEQVVSKDQPINLEQVVYKAQALLEHNLDNQELDILNQVLDTNLELSTEQVINLELPVLEVDL